jgi:hypothetical protein
MTHTFTRREAIATAALSLTVLPAMGDDKPAAIPENAMHLIVLDPLSAQLACPCVKAGRSRRATASRSA